MKLNIGCGKDIKPNFINIDRVKDKGVDLVINFNEERLINHFKYNSVDYIYCSHFLEHIIDPTVFIEDCIMSLKKSGVLEVKLPSTLRAGLYHLRTGFGKDYFHSLIYTGNLQGNKNVDIVVKGNFRHFKFLEYCLKRYQNFRDWFNRQRYDEYIYKITKK